MCAIFGFLNYGNKVNGKTLKKLLRALSVNAETRGTDATGISYVGKDGNIKVFKRPQPAHKLNLYFPEDTKCVIGHTRYTTQGDEKFNRNNHPFTSVNGNFSLAHNGVISNDTELHSEYNLPDTNIETDSYIAVQLLDSQLKLNFDTIKFMAENLIGSFMITILDKNNTLYLVKGSNPICLYHFKSLGLYVYASTEEILRNALISCGFNYKCCKIVMQEGDILAINSIGKAFKGQFDVYANYFLDDFYHEDPTYFEEYVEIFSHFGMSEAEVYEYLDMGYTLEDIEDMLYSGR